MRSMHLRASRTNSALTMCQTLVCENLRIRKLGTEQIHLGLRASPTFDTDALKDSRIRALFFHPFCKIKFSVTLLNGGRLLYLVLENSQVKVYIAFELCVPKVSKAQMYFHAVASMSRNVTRRKLNIV